MSPSMVPESMHGELGQMLLTGLTGASDLEPKPCELSQPARLPAFAALSQLRMSDADARGSILVGLSSVRTGNILCGQHRVLSLH